MGNVPIPKSYRAAVDGLHAEYWRAAIEKELSGLLALQTWDMILVSDLPKGANIMHSHFVFTVKRKADGSIEKFKARLVANGDSQKYGVDFDRVFSTVVKTMTIRLVLLSLDGFLSLMNSLSEAVKEHVRHVLDALTTSRRLATARDDARGRELIVYDDGETQLWRLVPGGRPMVRVPSVSARCRQVVPHLDRRPCLADAWRFHSRRLGGIGPSPLAAEAGAAHAAQLTSLPPLRRHGEPC